MSVLQNTGCMNKIDQMPIVLIPIHFDRDPSQVVSVPSILRSIVLRPVKTTDFMTCVPAVPGVHFPEEVVYKMQKAAEEVPVYLEFSTISHQNHQPLLNGNNHSTSLYVCVCARMCVFECCCFSFRFLYMTLFPERKKNKETREGKYPF
uniref:Uncharacterized protein n=1 Tax=Trichobilharzia regenti TaxID=157069 RepID=A0AA85JDN0_TRIRE|nr:unnamed protein product [Trichobilharzia regenti]